MGSTNECEKEKIFFTFFSWIAMAIGLLWFFYPVFTAEFWSHRWYACLGWLVLAIPVSYIVAVAFFLIGFSIDLLIIIIINDLRE